MNNRKEMNKMKIKPIAVLISDIHYNINTLEVADKALRMAVDKANELGVNLIVAGDLHDTKANIRAECIQAIQNTLGKLYFCLKAYLLRGNHDSLNEKSSIHSLSVLQNNSVEVVNNVQFYGTDYYLVPYHSDPEQLKAYLKTFPIGATLIMHQGLESSNSGHYIQDKSAVSHSDVKDYRVISGHYHQRQDIKTGRPRKGAVGLWSYLGNPYTLGFGEANDPEKGFSVLMSDGSLEFIPTNLRRHRIVEIDLEDGMPTVPPDLIKDSDILWVKITAASDRLAGVTREDIVRIYNIRQSFKLDLIPKDQNMVHIDQNLVQSKSEILDTLIDGLNESEVRKSRLKAMWKDLA